jgi:hypothetical protein
MSINHRSPGEYARYDQRARPRRHRDSSGTINMPYSDDAIPMRGCTSTRRCGKNVFADSQTPPSFTIAPGSGHGLAK